MDSSHTHANSIKTGIFFTSADLERNRESAGRFIDRLKMLSLDKLIHVVGDGQANGIPNIANLILYLVQNLQTGLAGDWQALNRSAVTVPALEEVSCNMGGSGNLVHGSRLDPINWTSDVLTDTSPSDQTAVGNGFSFKQCCNGQRLSAVRFSQNHRLRVKAYWIDGRLFDVAFPSIPACSDGKS